ncbi:MAG: hypothetical protein U0T83_05945 [Bacteriovoracaceae bacterium]
MKKFTILTTTALLSLNSFAAEIIGSINALDVGYEHNKANSVKAPIGLNGLAPEIGIKTNNKMEYFISPGFEWGIRTDDGKGIIKYKGTLGSRYNISDKFKVGGGIRYSYNDSKQEDYSDVSVVADARYKLGKAFVKLEVSKSISEASGLGASVGVGSGF